MSKISDELREVTDKYFTGVTKAWMYAFANRIDAEMVEWPLGADKKQIKLSQTVYDQCGGEWEVVGITFTPLPGIALVRLEHDDTELTQFAGDLTHERPDSWERIADELDEWSEDNRVNGDDDVFRRAREIADRIRRLAEREEDEQ